MEVAPYNRDDNLHAYNADLQSYVSYPKPSLNGGLFTGEAFHKDAPYANFPNKAEAVHLHTSTLTSAGPPPGAQQQFPDTFRPGNNMPLTDTIMLAKYKPTHAIMCPNIK